MSYTANSGYEGPDAFEVRADDGHGGFHVGTVTIAVSSENTAPECPNQEFSTWWGTTGPLPSLNCVDADDDPLTYTLGDPPAHGDVIEPEPRGAPYDWRSAADPGYVGADWFTVVVSDGETTSTLTMSVSIIGPRIPTLPVCQSVSLTVPLDCVDSEGNHPLLAIVEPPAPETGSLGDMNLAPPSVVFTPAAGFTGLARFTFRGNEIEGSSELATVEIRVGERRSSRPPTRWHRCWRSPRCHRRCRQPPRAAVAFDRKAVGGRAGDTGG